MFGSLLKNFMGQGQQLQEVIDAGAALVDVRTSGEFSMGSVPGAVNIPLDRIQGSVNKVKKMKKPVVVFCASGMRSASAAAVLRGAGVEQVFNGGSVGKVSRLLQKTQNA